MRKFLAGVRRMPVFWQIWLVVLMIVNGIAPFFYLSEGVAIVTLVAFATGGVIGAILCEVQGFTKLLGLMHGPWVALFALQILVLRAGVSPGGFRNWLLVSTLVTFLSLILDIADVVAYLKGNRSDLLARQM